MPKKDLNHLISREVANFIVDRRAKKLSPKTIEFYSSELRLWLEHLSSIQKVVHIEELEAQQMVRRRFEEIGIEEPGLHSFRRTFDLQSL